MNTNKGPQPEPEKMAPVQGFSAGIPWSLHLEAYDAYCKKYGKQQALIEGWCRGGFGTGELDEYIPGWRDRVSEITKLMAELAALREALATSALPQPEGMGRDKLPLTKHDLDVVDLLQHIEGYPFGNRSREGLQAGFWSHATASGALRLIRAAYAIPADIDAAIAAFAAHPSTPENSNPLREALAELVACKDLKERLEKLHNMGRGTDWDAYHRRQPLAWEAARRALSGSGYPVKTTTE